MKRLLKLSGELLLASTLLFACNPKEKKAPKKNPVETVAYDYSVRVEAADDLNSAPALQSFVHASHGDEWLLFAGRTNRDADEGGLHKQAAKTN